MAALGDIEARIAALGDIEARIAALQAQLERQRDGLDDEEEGEGDGPQPLRDGRLIAGHEGSGGPATMGLRDDESAAASVKVLKEAASDVLVTDALEPIPPLPPTLLPLPQSLAGASSGQRCRTCDEWFASRAEYKNHVRSLDHSERAALQAGRDYRALHLANYCRCCQMKFASVDALLEHRKTQDHVRKEKHINRASFCVVCRKQFTSPLQLREHINGKAHKTLVSGGGEAVVTQTADDDYDETRKSSEQVNKKQKRR